MPATYYKATRPDGTDFMTGMIDYGAALVSGEIIRHPAAKRVKEDASTYLSVATVPTDCTGFRWPCRLFEVHGVGRRPMTSSVYPNKRAFSALRVVREIPAHEAFGPQGREVVALIERCRVLTTAAAAVAAGGAARAAAWDAAVGAAAVAAQVAARHAARYAARVAAWGAAWDASRDTAGARYPAGVAARGAAAVAAGVAAGALVIRDLISDEHYRILTERLFSVIGEPHTWGGEA